MKSTKKIILTAGMLFQLSASMYANNWSDAFLAFGGGSDVVAAADFVLNHPNAVTPANALTVSKSLNTAEGSAVARWMANNKKNAFNSPLQDADVQAAARDMVTRSMPESFNNAQENNAQVSNATDNNAQTNNAQTNNAQPSTGSSWFPSFGGSSTTQAQAGANSQAVIDAQIARIQAAADAQIAAIRAQQETNIKTAMQTQQQEDAARAAQQQQALINIVNSGATGATLYNSYIDLIMNSLQEALSSIADANVKQQVVSYAQNKLANMKASASMNSHTSHALGRMSSKKPAKKGKNSRLHATR